MKSKGIFGNVSGSLVMQMVNIITNLILPPLIIREYGSQMNGLVSTVTQIISYISLVGAGLSVSTTQSLYKPLAENDNKTISGMMKASGNMFNKVGWAFVFIATGVALLYPLFIECEMPYLSVVLLMLVMSISGAMEFFATGRYRSLLQADRRIYVYSLIQAGCLLFSTLLAIFSIKLGLSILWTQFFISIVYVLRAACLSLYVKRNYPFINKDEKPINECIAKRKDAMYHQLIGLIVTGSQSILLSIFVGLEAASIYAVYNVVFSGLQSICVQISNAVVPYLGRSYALNKEGDIKRKYDAFELVFFAFITVVFSIAFVMFDSFIRLYTKGADINYEDSLLVVMFVTRGFASTFRLPSQGMINAAGFFAETKKAATIEAGICIITELIAVQFIGIYGIMLGNLLALVWRGFEMIIYTNRHIIIRKVSPSIMRVIESSICIVLIYVIGNHFISADRISDYFEWVLCSFAAGIIALFITFCCQILLNRKVLIKAVNMIF
jgi:O-antigen/teichoic acid export membrane protein